jgi:hypothetical protein
MKSCIICDMMSCGPLKVNLRFEGTCYLCQRETGGKQTACHFINASLLLGLIFDQEDGGDMFLGNVG